MKWLIGGLIIIAAGIIAISFYLQPNSFAACDERPTNTTGCGVADAIVVISGGDTVARTAAGINLYKEGWAPYMVLSGAAMDKSGPSNAEAMRQQAEAAGVPAQAIVIDEEAVNTNQNAVNTRSISRAHQFTDIILVTSGYHQRRASLEFHRAVETATIRDYPVLHDKDWSWFWWMTPRGWWLAGGELVKIIAFYAGATA